MDEEEPNVFIFQDDQLSNEPTYEYEEDIKIDQVPIIIDNGSYKCRAGWAYDAEPKLVFRSLVAKLRSKKEETQVGNDIPNIEVVKWQLRSQFDRNIVTQHDVQEQIFDHIFSHLGVDTEGKVDHPIVLTEPLCNPNLSRQYMNELLFECYHVPQVAYGVDSLFSLYNNHENPETISALIISCGYQTTHIIVVIDGKVEPKFSRRINIGGCQVDGLMQRLIQLRHPGHINHMTLSRAEELVQNHTFLAENFKEEVDAWFSEDHYIDHVHKIQLPYNATVSKVDPETQKQRREEQARRLKQLAAKKREEKLAEEQDKLQELVFAQQILEEEDDDRRYKKILKKIGVEDEEDLQDAINELNNSIHKLMNKIQEESNKSSYKGGSEAKKAKIEKKTDITDPPVGNDAKMKLWLQNIRSQRQQLLNKKEERRKKRSDMTKRRTHASQQRMKIITELAQGRKSKKDDTFGMRDEDWNVYKEINKDAGDSDSEAEQEKIDELGTYLKEYDPEFKDPNEASQEVDIKEYYRLHVAVEQIRAPEVLFQPSIIGVDQAGIAETIDFVLNQLSPEQQEKVVQNVFITGGCGSFKNFKGRIEHELRAMRPFESKFNVFTSNDPVLGAWRGAGKWAMCPEFDALALTKVDYDEKGVGYLNEHTVTNRYFVTPDKETIIESDSVSSLHKSESQASLF